MPTTSTETPPPSTAAEAPTRARAITPRAVAVGLVVGLGLGWLTPWNDWQLNNTYVFNDYLPPAVVVGCLALALVVNPLLGRRRFAGGEAAVVVALVLAVGGVASSGLARYWPGVVGGPARVLAREPKDALRVPLDASARAAVRARLERAARRDFAALDADGDGRLVADEVWGGAARIARDDRDGDGALSRDEYVAGRLAADPAAGAAWRWAFPDDLALGLPAAGDIDAEDAGYRRAVDGFLDGAPRPDQPRVAHGARVTWRGADGATHRDELALSGAQRESHARRGALDLDDDLGRALVGRRAGERVDTPDGAVVVERVEPPPPVPWRAWLRPALAWSPMVLALCLVSVGAAFVVRRQWLHHERLTYPIANAIGALIAEPAPGARLPALLRARGFWIGAAIAFAIVAWRGCALEGWVSLSFTLELDLVKPFGFEPWSRMPDFWAVLEPRIYFTFVAVAFLVPLEISFSIWAIVVGGNLLVMWLRGLGCDVTWQDAHDVGYGGYAVLAPMIVWLGRRYYWSVLRAALGLRADAPARAAAPWLWCVVAGLALFALWLRAHGATTGAAVGAALMWSGALLVVSRAVAESGIPLITFPGGNIDDALFGSIGFGLPTAALIPLALIGMVQTDPREALMPYATTGGALADGAQATSARRLPALMLVASLAGAVVACASAVAHAYGGSGFSDHFRPYIYELDRVASQQPADAAAVARLGAERGAHLVSYGVGAAITALCAGMRMLVSWWPLHPLALAVATSWGGQMAWPSFLVAWLAKLTTLRYGGVGVYKRLVPVAIGLAVGESTAIALFALIKIVATGWFGVPLEAYKSALPV